MIVIPQAINEGNGTMWNAALMPSDIDDSGFLMALLDSLAVQYPVNQDSIFFTGFSMGGFMSHRMAIEHGDRINAAFHIVPLPSLIACGMTTIQLKRSATCWKLCSLLTWFMLSPKPCRKNITGSDS